MSKSILIVICDFLVLSLISLVNFEDMPSATQEDKQKEEAIVVKSFADAQKCRSTASGKSAKR